MATFDIDTPVTVVVENGCGRVDLQASDSGETEVVVEPLNDDELTARVVAETRIEHVGDTLQITVPPTYWPSSVAIRRFVTVTRLSDVAVTVRVPTGSKATVKAGTADVDATGEWASLYVRTTTGRVSAQHVTGEFHVHTASGSVVVGQVDGQSDVHCTRGAVDLGRVGAVTVVRLVSGKLRIGTANGSVSVHSTSGRVAVEEMASGTLGVRSVSGDVDVGVCTGSQVFVDASSTSGSLRSELELDDDPPEGDGPMVEIRAQSVSGNIRIARAGSSVGNRTS